MAEALSEKKIITLLIFLGTGGGPVESQKIEFHVACMHNCHNKTGLFEVYERIKINL